jgi:hypothetical protein
LPLEQVDWAFKKVAKSEKVSRRAKGNINELKDQRIKKFEERLIHKNEVITELMDKNEPESWKWLANCFKRNDLRRDTTQAS